MAHRGHALLGTAFATRGIDCASAERLTGTLTTRHLGAYTFVNKSDREARTV
jgi:hypothetical protein